MFTQGNPFEEPLRRNEMVAGVYSELYSEHYSESYFVYSELYTRRHILVVLVVGGGGKRASSGKGWIEAGCSRELVNE